MARHSSKQVGASDENCVADLLLLLLLLPSGLTSAYTASQSLLFTESNRLHLQPDYSVALRTVGRLTYS